MPPALTQCLTRQEAASECLEPTDTFNVDRCDPVQSPPDEEAPHGRLDPREHVEHVEVDEPREEAPHSALDTDCSTALHALALAGLLQANNAVLGCCSAHNALDPRRCVRSCTNDRCSHPSARVHADSAGEQRSSGVLLTRLALGAYCGNTPPVALETRRCVRLRRLPPLATAAERALDARGCIVEAAAQPRGFAHLAPMYFPSDRLNLLHLHTSASVSCVS